jgi:hypothetical protein
VNFGEFPFFPRTRVNKGKKVEGRGDYMPPPANLVRNPGGCDP